MEPTDEAGAWLRGEGDLMTAASGRPVPVHMQLGVFAHAGLGRLTDLGRYSRRGSVRRSWGAEMAEFAGELATFAPSANALSELQRTILVPLEVAVLGGQVRFESRQQLLATLRDKLSSARLEQPAT